jgi:hypothetical protein
VKKIAGLSRVSREPSYSRPIAARSRSGPIARANASDTAMNGSARIVWPMAKWL